MDIKKVLVPTDFTEVTNYALRHAKKLTEASGGKVVALHVVKSQDQVEAAKEKVQAQIDKNGLTNASALVRIGGIVSNIGDAASEVGANVVIMGTHGPQGLRQMLTGSDAMKVITHSTKPFIVVQETEIGDTGYDDIVVPLDMTDDTKQKLDEVADIAKYFDSRVHIYAKREKDSFFAQKLKNNIAFTKKYFAEKGMEINIEISETKKGFDDEVVAFAKSVNADLIAIVNFQGWNVFGGLFSRREEEIITNKEKIPVLVVNPIDVKGAYTN